MKKKLHCLLFAALLLVALFAFASCQEDGPLPTPTPDDECTHSWHEEVVEEPWCNHGGLGIRYCELCGYTEQYDIPELGHDEVHINYQAPTCTEWGHTAGSYCSRCETVLSESHYVEPTGHTEVLDEGYDATCTEEGLTDGYHCSVCEAVLTEQTTIDALGHDWAYSDPVEATCTADGHTAGQKCTRCEHVEVEETVIPATGHTEVPDTGYAATCTEEGLTDGKHCSVCEEVTVEQTVIPSKGHTIAYHEEEATCQHGGKTGGVYCSVCEVVFSETTVSDRVDHVFVNGACKWCHLAHTSGLEFELNAAGDGYLVVGIGTFTGANVVIPDAYNGKPVVGIGYEAFKNNTTIKSVTVTGTATTVSSYAFSGCTALETVTLPKSVLTVGDGAFAGCTSLKTVTCADFTQTAGWSKSLFDEGSTARLCAEANNGKTPYEVYLDALKQLSLNANSYVLDDVRNIVLKMYSYLMDSEGNPIDEDGNLLDIENGDQPIPAWIDFMSMVMTSHTEYAGTEYYVGTSSVYEVLGSPNSSEFTEAAYYNGYLYGKNASGQNVKIKCGTEYLRAQAQAVVAGAPTFSEDDFKNVAFCKNADGTYSLVIVLSGEAATEYGKYMVSQTGGASETFEILAYKDITYTYLFDKNGVLSSIDCKCNVEGAKDSQYEGLLAGTVTCDMDYSSVGTLTKLGRTPTQTYTDYSYTGTCTHGSTTTVKGYEATCTEAGLTDGIYCSRCYANVTVATVIPAKGHTVVDGVCTVCNNPAGYSTGLKYVYNADGKTATLVGLGSCTDKNVVIPTSIYGITITKISKDAFKGATGVTSLTIPATVTTVEAGALEPLTALEKITLGTAHVSAIPKTVRSVVLTGGETIAAGSFVDFKSLREITLPATLTSIEDGAFSGCTKLVLVYNNSELYVWAGSTDCGGVAEYAEEVVTKGGSSTLIVQGDFVFKYASSSYKLVKYLGSSKKVILPATCNGESYVVAEGAFSGCGIEELTAPKNIVPDGYASSLLGFEEIKKVTGDLALIAALPEEHLTHVEIISNKNGWSSSSSLLAYAPELVWVKLDVDVDYAICYKCNKLETVIIGDNVTTLTQPVFDECSAVNLTIGAGVQAICPSAFGPVNKLYIENVAKWCAIEFNYNHWYSNTFNPISNAKEVWIGNGALGGTGYTEFASLELWAYKTHDIDVSKISAYAFYNYKGLTELVLDDSTAEIGENAFAGCTSLKTVNFGDPTTLTLGDSAFNACTSLTAVTLTSCAAKVGSSAFAGCTSLKTVTITLATGSGSELFKGCTALTTVTLGEGTSAVPNSAFEACTALKTVTLHDGLTKIGDKAFNGCTALRTVNLPEGLTSIGSYAFKGASFYTLTLPKSLTSIGSNAFYECHRLFEVINRSSLTVTVGNSDNGYVGKYATVVTSGEDAESTLRPNDEGFVFAAVTTGDATTTYLVTYLGTAKRLTLPSNGGYEIAPYAFAGSRVVTLVIPDVVTNIGKYAFKDSALRSLTVGSGITSDVSRYAFYDFELAELVNNSQLKDEKLINKFSSGSVEYCHDGESKLTEDANGFLFLERDGAWYLVGYVGADVETLRLPDNINGKNYHVGDYAFRYAEISAIEVPNDVLSFASSALPTDFAGYTVDENDPEQAKYVGNATNPHLVLVAGGRTDWSNSAKTESVTVIDKDSANREEVTIKAVKVNIHENTKIISDNAFVYSNGYGSSSDRAMVVSIPNSVTYIGDQAFGGCFVYSLTLGDNVAYIGDRAFAGAEMVTLTIPKNVSHVGTDAFDDCDNLENIYWNAECVESVDTPFGVDTRNGDKKLTIGKDVKTVPDNLLYHTWSSYDYKVVGTVTVEEGAKLEKIGAYAFYRATGLASIDLSYATEIGNGAFSYSDLASVTLGNKLTTIGSSAFESCENLTELTIPESVTSIGKGALSGCGVKKLTLPGIVSIGDLFNYRYDHQIPGNIEYTVSGSTLAKEMFRYVSSGSISFTGTVTEVGSNAFYGCTWLTDEMFAGAFGNLKTIGDSAFSGCTGLTAIDLSKVETIGAYAFSGCTALTGAGKNGELELSFVKSIGEYAFEGCTSLTEVIVNENATTVKSSAFDGCKVLTKLTVPVFITVSTVEELTINGSATEVPEQFYRHPYSSGYSNLKKLILPTSIETIGDQAFKSCPNLASVNFGELTSLKTIGSYAFQACKSLGAEFCDGLTSIGKFAFQNARFTKLRIPSSLETLGSYSLFGSTTTMTSYISYIAGLKEDGGVTEYGGCYYVGNSTNPYLVLVCGVNRTASTPITVHEDTKFIAEDAFCSFNNMTELTLGASVTYIGYGAFDGCKALTKINVASLEQWNSITFGESDYSGEQYQPFATDRAEYAGLYVNGTLVNETTYTGGGYNSFLGYKHATTITVASGVTAIPAEAFKNMGALTTVHLPEGLLTIGDYAFSGCTWLATINIPSTVTSIGKYAFESTRIASVTLPDGLATLQEGVFKNCLKLRHFDLNNVTTIEANALYQCVNVRWLYIPSTVTTIKSGAFTKSNVYVCTQAYSEPSGWEYGWGTNATVKNNATIYTDDNCLVYAIINNVSAYLLDYVGTSTELTIPETANGKKVGLIVEKAFKDNTILEKVTILCSSDGGTVMGDYAFAGCTSLTSVEIGGNCSKIGYNAFQGCTALTTVTVDANCSKICQYAFDGCTSLASLTFNTDSSKDWYYYDAVIDLSDPATNAKYFNGTEMVVCNLTDSYTGSAYTKEVNGTLYEWEAK